MNTILFKFLGVVAGIFMTGFFIVDSTGDWLENPTITTIDPVSNHIKDLPFPAVTICPQLDLNPWAFPELIGDDHKFECDDSSKHYPKCNQTTEILKDFGFLKERVLNAIESKLRALEQANTSWPHINPKFKAFRSSAITWLHQNLTTAPALEAHIRSNVGQHRSYIGFLKSMESQLGKFRSLPQAVTDSDKKRLADATKDAEYVLKKSQFLWDGNGFLPFGQFLSKFSHLVGKSFRKLPYNSQLQPNRCGSLETMEIKIHDYYASMALALGFENVSIFDLGQIVTPLSFAKSFNPIFREVSPYSNCHFNNAPSGTALKRHSSCQQVWQEWTQGEPDLCLETPRCCAFHQTLGGLDKLENLMRMMKFAMHLSSAHINLTELGEPFRAEKALRILKYPMNEFRLGKYWHSKDKLFFNPHTVLPVCFFKDGRYQSFRDTKRRGRLDCTLFKPVITNIGLCHGFNSESLESLHPPHPYLDAMKRAFAQELNRNLSIFPATGTSDDLGLTVFLDRRTFLQPDLTDIDNIDIGRMLIGLNPPWKPFNMRSKTISVRVGYQTHIQVTLVRRSAPDELRALTLDARRCRFPEEVPSNMTFFKSYTQDSCKFECLLRKASTRCECTPWNYPYLVEEFHHQTCDTFSTICFEEVLKNSAESELCPCLADCLDIEYKYTEKEWPIDVNALCRKSLTMHLYSILKVSRGFYPKFLYRYDYLMNGVNFGTADFEVDESMEFCRQVLKQDFSLITVKMGSEYYQRTVLAPRVTLAGQIAAIGGTLGLFTGMSFLSVVEIIFWIIRFFFKSITDLAPRVPRR